jgi:hypothetical protein
MKPKLLEATLGGGRLLKRTSGVLIVAAFGTASLYGAISAFAAPPSKTAVDAENASYAQMMLDEGKKTFRYETFGSEAFWALWDSRRGLSQRVRYGTDQRPRPFCTRQAHRLVAGRGTGDQATPDRARYN